MTATAVYAAPLPRENSRSSGGARNLNAGEPIAEDEDLFGTVANEAARITAAAKGGEILVADVVRQLAKGKDFLFADRGETSLRGFEDPHAAVRGEVAGVV